MQAVLVIDQGTHATRALLFDARGHRIQQVFCPIALQQRSQEIVEQDPVEIITSTQQALAQICDGQQHCITSAALVCQRSTLVAWDRRTGKTVTPAISWMDTRCTTLLKRYQKYAQRIHALTGLMLSPHYLAGKIRWLLENEPAVIQDDNKPSLIFSPLISLIAFHLMPSHPLIVDQSNASRTLLFDIQQERWSHELLDVFGVTEDMLPACNPVIGDFGPLIEKDIPLHCLCGDQQAMLYANGRPNTDTLYINIGTGAFIVRPVGTQRMRCPGIMTTPLPNIDGFAAIEYMLEGSINGAGQALEWFRKTSDMDEDAFYLCLDEWAKQPRLNCQFMNTMGGVGSPWWVAGMPSIFIPQHALWHTKAVAIVESIVFMLMRNLQSILAHTPRLTRPRQIHISGKVAGLDCLCQWLANLMQMPVIRFVETEATARGAAWMISEKKEQWHATDVEKTFLPMPEEYTSTQKHYVNFLQSFEHHLGSKNKAAI